MNAPADAVGTLLQLPAPALTEIGRALAGGILRHGFSAQSLAPFCGPSAVAVNDALRQLSAKEMSLASLGMLCEGLGRALAARDEVERNVQLVLSGPEVTGTPVVDTRTTVMSLFREAVSEVVIASYVFHEAAEFFQHLAEKHDANPEFRVVFLLDLTHRRTAAREPASVIAPAFCAEFRKKHWPGRRAPEIWHDPRKFEPEPAEGGVLHAKAVIVDARTALVTSANFTEAAQTRNIEAGALLRRCRAAAQLHAYFTGLIGTGVLRRLAV
jgi:phosphatidylserine/phosphatidylglycerophosphate/cardiolipin synthase-like enzyme